MLRKKEAVFYALLLHNLEHFVSKSVFEVRLQNKVTLVWLKSWKAVLESGWREKARPERWGILGA